MIWDLAFGISPYTPTPPHPFPPFALRHGFLLIDKPAGLTSHDVVARARRQLEERDVGHLGTLDPAATGLLVLAVGKKALKVIELFGDLSKRYVADVAFGLVSTTYDREGVIEAFPIPAGWEEPEHVVIQELIANRFIGKVSQVPPAHSAVHVGGERAYRKARAGIGVNIPPRDVLIHSCGILSYAYPKLVLNVHCGSGTYIRSLAHDLGQLLRCGAYLSALRRTEVGEWSVQNAVSPDHIKWTDVIPLKNILTSQSRLALNDEEFENISHGRMIDRAVTKDTIGWHAGLPVAILEPVGESQAHARKVF